MKEAARQARAESRIIGLVPTMGALHAGHLSLIERARRECSSVIASIFVNPKQFGPNEDFSKYPRTFESDSEKLERAGVHWLFAPEPAEIYPNAFSTYVNVDGLSDRLEGRSRPGHFRGVTTVVMKLLQIVQPNFAYFGRKDAQQSRKRRLFCIGRWMQQKASLPPEFAMGCNCKRRSSARWVRSGWREWTMQRSWMPNRSSRSCG